MNRSEVQKVIRYFAVRMSVEPIEIGLSLWAGLRGLWLLLPFWQSFESTPSYDSFESVGRIILTELGLSSRGDAAEIALGSILLLLAVVHVALVFRDVRSILSGAEVRRTVRIGTAVGQMVLTVSMLVGFIDSNPASGAAPTFLAASILWGYVVARHYLRPKSKRKEHVYG